MNNQLRASVAGVAFIALVFASAAPAFGQSEGPQRPYRGTFGGSAPQPDVRHSLDVSVSLFGAYDNINDVSGAAQSPFLETGAYLGLMTGLRYAWQGQHAQIGANVGTSLRYYGDERELAPAGYGGGVGFAADLARNTRLFANQSIAYSPAYMYGVFPELGLSTGEVVGIGDPLSDSQVYIYDTALTLTHAVSRRGSIEFLANQRYSDFEGGSGANRDLRAWGIGGRYRQGLTRYLSLKLGYVYRKGSYGFGGATRPTVVHDIEAGFDYRRALSLTRRTTFDFSVGSTVVNAPAAEQSSTELAYRVVGDVGLNHEMGRTWRTRVAYNRGVDFSEAFAQPVFSDGLNASVTGFFSRRVDFRGNAGVSVGDIGLGVVRSRFRAYSASANVRFALAEQWALLGNYQYYFHDLGQVLIVPEGVPSNVGRNTVSVGLTFWVPFLGR